MLISGLEWARRRVACKKRRRIMAQNDDATLSIEEARRELLQASRQLSVLLLDLSMDPERVFEHFAVRRDAFFELLSDLGVKVNTRLEEMLRE
ncbi:hypothetical protein WL89_06570 [Burkholderia cenocepacia]|nr:hypothetical protein WL89_06570 [Burkholderia cenocepacia]